MEKKNIKNMIKILNNIIIFCKLLPFWSFFFLLVWWKQGGRREWTKKKLLTENEEIPRWDDCELKKKKKERIKNKNFDLERTRATTLRSAQKFFQILCS